VAAALEAAVAGAGEGGTFNLSEDEPVTARALLEGMAAALGARCRVVGVPSALVVAAARGLERLGATIPGARDLALSRVAALLTENNPYRSDRARAVLGWRTVTPHAEGLRRTAAWLLGRGGQGGRT
ncbi:MAG: hypothetical protein D6701_06365, partial [Gemmatimonadetes bacterium]